MPKYIVLTYPGECAECTTRDDVLDVLEYWPDAVVIERGPDIARSFDAEAYRREDEMAEADRAEAEHRAALGHRSNFV